MNELIEGIIESRCGYCHNTFDKESLSSSWGESDVQHYKQMKCSCCGKKVWTKVEFMGSGHDEAIIKKDLTLESVLFAA